MIDPLSEEIRPLAEWARRLPPLRRGRPVHVSTLWRWAMRGLRGIRLETVLVGGARVTSADALRRFFANTGTSPMGPPSNTTTLRNSARSRENASARAEKQLEADGI